MPDRPSLAFAGDRSVAISTGLNAHKVWYRTTDLPKCLIHGRDPEWIRRETVALCTTMRDPWQWETTAQVLVLVHLLDDLIDLDYLPEGQRSRLCEGVFRVRRTAGELPNQLDREPRLVFERLVNVLEKSLPLQSRPDAYAAAAGALQYLVYDALLQQRPDQVPLLLAELKELALASLPSRLRTPFEAIAPSAFSVLSHAGLAPFLLIEGNHDPALAAILDLWYGPLLYAADVRDLSSLARETHNLGLLVSAATYAMGSVRHPIPPTRLEQMRLAVDHYCSVSASHASLDFCATRTRARLMGRLRKRYERCMERL